MDVVAAYGGDGTVSEAVSGLVGTDVPLMILPGGTNNVLAAEFGVPGKLADAVEQLFHSTPRAADVGQVDLGTDEVRSNCAGGPSDRRFSRWYASEMDRWLENAYKTLRADASERQYKF